MLRASAFAVAAFVLASAGPAAARYSDQQISQALMGNAWCRYAYSQTTGYSSSRRAVFGADGYLRISRSGEGVSSGPNGSAYGASQGQDVYRWRVSGGALVLSDAEGTTTVELDAGQDSSGRTLLYVNGDEWYAC